MNDDNVQKNIRINDIGDIAQVLDNELTVFERMKINKDTLFRVVGAVIIYLTMMFLFSIFL